MLKLDNRLILEETGISTYQQLAMLMRILGRFESAIEFQKGLGNQDFDDQIAYELAAFSPDREGINVL